MDQVTLQVLTFVLGVASSIVASAIYDKYKVGKSRKAAILRKREEVWRERLSSDDANIRGRAYEEILMNVFKWLVLGTMMSCIAGIGWILDFLQMFAWSNSIASLSSVVAVLIFAASFSWIRLYFKHSKTIEKELSSYVSEGESKKGSQSSTGAA